MGLTARSTGKGAMDRSLTIERGGTCEWWRSQGTPTSEKAPFLTS